jgi:hypothetical protein
MAVAVFDCVLAEAISTMARRIQEQRRATDLDHLLARILADYPLDDTLWVLPDVPPLYADIVKEVPPSRQHLGGRAAQYLVSVRR